MKFFIILSIVEFLIILIYLLAKAKLRKYHILNRLTVQSEVDYQEQIADLEKQVNQRDTELEKINKKLRKVANEKEPDTVDDLVSLFNNLSSRNNSD